MSYSRDSDKTLKENTFFWKSDSPRVKHLSLTVFESIQAVALLA